MSLLPLTLGVMLACSFDMSASNAVGILCSFGSALVFVSSNIFFKKIMPSNTGGGASQSSHKLDKLNLLLYSSGMAFLLMIPIWIFYDLPALLSASSEPDHVVHPAHGHARPHSVTYYFFMNGTVHFAQNIIAFVILSSTSPVTYSIASLIKRVVVICIAIVWFNQIIHPIQGFGIALTFAGLYMYNNAKSDVELGEKRMRRVEAARDLMLPSTKAESRMMGMETPPELDMSVATVETSGMDLLPSASSYSRPRGPTTAPHLHSQNMYNPQLYSQGPPPPTPRARALTIKVTPQMVTTKDARAVNAVSPVDSYPSPPPSLDSPPSKTIPLRLAEDRRLADIQERLGPALSHLEQHES